MPNNTITKSFSNSLITTRCDYCKSVTTELEAIRNFKHKEQKNDGYDAKDGDRVKVVFTPAPTANLVHHCNRSFLDRLFSVPTALQPPDRSKPPIESDPNIFAIKKTVMTLICLVIIIMENSVQLKFLIKYGHSFFSNFYPIQLGLGISSVVLAAFIGLILMYSARINYNDVYKQRKLDFINNSVMILLFVLCLFNIFLVSMN